MAAEEPSEADPVGPASLDREHPHIPESQRPREQFCVAEVRCVEVELTEMFAEAIQRDGDVFIFVGVDADDDAGAFECDASHDC